MFWLICSTCVFIVCGVRQPFFPRLSAIITRAYTCAILQEVFLCRQYEFIVNVNYNVRILLEAVYRIVGKHNFFLNAVLITRRSFCFVNKAKIKVCLGLRDLP